MVLGLRVAMSAAVMLKNSPRRRSIARRTSPSVTMPSIRSPSQITIRPSPPFEMAWIISAAGQSGATTGRSWSRMTLPTVISRRRPRLPPGCRRAKSTLVKPRICISDTASASPMAICAVVDEVGARCRMQASSFTPTSRCTSEFLASAESGFPVIETILLPLEWMKGTILRISSVSPE